MGRKRKVEESDDDIDDDEDDDENEFQNVESLDFCEDGPPTKKTKSGKKLPTNEEMARIKETENLFQSSIFRLQISELLTEVRLKAKKVASINLFISSIKEVLLSLKPGRLQNLRDFKSLKDGRVEFPLNVNPKNVKGKFQFHPPRVVRVGGSFLHRSCLKPHPCVDLYVEMPKQCFQTADHLNQRYFRKRACYLVNLASQLRSCDLVESLSFTYDHGCHMRPVLNIKPSATSVRSLTVKLYPYPEHGVFELNRFHIRENNVRSSWYQKTRPSEAGEVDIAEPATPHYNTWVLRDLVQDTNQGFLEHSFVDCPGVYKGLALLKVWLHQRELDQGRGAFTGYIMMMYVAYLVSKRKLNRMMSSAQILRNTLLFLSDSDWTTSGLSLVSDDQSDSKSDSSRPLLVDFHEAFDVVFVDHSGYLNFCCDMNKSTFFRVKHEAKLSIEYFEGVSGFAALFMTPVKFMTRFDQYFHVSCTGSMKQLIEKLGQSHVLMDLCGETGAACIPPLLDLIQKALGDRIHLIDVRFHHPQQWSIESVPPTASENLTFGLLINKDKAYGILDRGPAADVPQAKEFREFWGEKSELRRFQDSSICEAVVWPSETLADRRKIVGKVVEYILKGHAGIEKDKLLFFGSQMDSLLNLPLPKSQKDLVYGTGEEELLSVQRSYDDLAKSLRNLSGLPLAIHNIHGLSPALRYTEMFPPMATISKLAEKSEDFDVWKPNTKKRSPSWMPALRVLCQLESSGKWPTNIDAIQRVKAAFLIKIGQLLRREYQLNNQVTATYLDVFKDGLVFRIELGYKKEINLNKLVTLPSGMIKTLDNDNATRLQHQLVYLPALTSALHGLHQHNTTFSSTVRLAKRWVSSQLLLEGHMKEEAVELLVSRLFVNPAPYEEPKSPMVGFQRFLTLLSTHNWQEAPLVVNFNNKLSREVYNEFQSRFTKNRDKLPLMFIATPLDKLTSYWTKQYPTPQILTRLAVLARKSLEILEMQMEKREKGSDFKQVFRPPLEPYDLIIHLEPSKLSRQHHAVDITTATFLPCYREEENSADACLPVIEYNPVLLYLKELKDCFGDLALFFHDTYGGDIIAVLWKPQAFKPIGMLISHVQGRMPMETTKGKSTELVPNIEALLENFKVIGKGLVTSIDARTEKWSI